MTAEELNTVLETLGWRGSELARRVDVSQKAVSDWRRGKRPVPGPVRAYVKLVAGVEVALVSWRNEP